MLLVRTRLGLSPIEGIGCFAAEPLRAGTPVWRFVPGFDRMIDPDLAAKCDESWLAKYAQECPLTGYWVLCADDARFINHADEPNVSQRAPLFHPAYVGEALRDIEAGEELTMDYRIGDRAPFSGFAELAQSMGVAA